jgi:methylated-DNA-[protein]-cysteine S-methyltransferase
MRVSEQGDAEIGRMACETIETPIGPYSIVVADGVLRAAGFTADTARLSGTLGVPGGAHVGGAGLAPIVEAVRRYFDGALDALDTIPVAQVGGLFTAAAWAEMRRVSASTTITYRQLAQRSGRPDAVRAAGAACAGNRIALVVPCHRILRTGGGLGGYLWGLPVKQWLLEHEGASVPPPSDAARTRDHADAERPASEQLALSL